MKPPAKEQNKLVSPPLKQKNPTDSSSPEKNAIRSLWQHIRNLRNDALAVDALDSLIDVISIEPTEDETVLANRETLFARLRMLGLHMELLHCMENHLDDEVIQQDGFHILDMLTYYAKKDEMTLLLDLDVVHLIREALEQFYENRDMIECALNFLTSLGSVEKDPDYDAAFLAKLTSDPSIIPTICNVTAKSTKVAQSSHIQVSLLEVMNNLIVSDKAGTFGIRQVLVAHGAISQVARVLEQFPSDPEMQNRARKVLHSLCPLS